MAALIIAIFPQNSSRGNWEEQQDRTDPNSRFELARKPAWLLAFRQFGLPKWKHDFELERQIADRVSRRAAMHQFIGVLKKQKDLITEFDPSLWGALLDHATIYRKDDIRFTFKDGTEINAVG